MSRVLTTATVENYGDLWDVQKGLCTEDNVRRLEIRDALVDASSTTLALPTRMIDELGLRWSNAEKGINVYCPVRVTIQGRCCTFDVMEVPNDMPPAIGQIPLAMLDLVIDPRQCRLTGNPAHGGEHVLELL